VVLYSKAKEIRELAKVIKDLPDIREEKVAELKKQIDQGTYKVDGEKIAFKMIKEFILDEILLSNESFSMSKKSTFSKKF